MSNKSGIFMSGGGQIECGECKTILVTCAPGEDISITTSFKCPNEKCQYGAKITLSSPEDK